MKQAKLTHDQIEYLRHNGYTFTSRFYYWIVCDDTNIVNRITRAEFISRSIAELSMAGRGNPNGWEHVLVWGLGKNGS